MNKPTVAYIIIGWNNKDLLEECIDSLNKQTYQNKKILYVDNGSKDGSVQFVKDNFPQVIVLEMGYNALFAKANNVGIQQALQDESVGYVALINTDATIDPEWTETIVKFALGKPLGALFQTMTLDYYNHSIIDSTHIYVSRNGQGTQAYWRQYYTRELGPKKVFGVNAAACMVSRAFIESQPFSDILDETMSMYLEDVDLSCRATILGWDCYLVPGARAYHMGSASSGKNPGFSLYMTFRNNTALLIKNFPILMLFRMFPGIIRGDLETIRTLYKTGRSSAIPKVLKGRFIGTFRSILFLGKRHEIARQRKISHHELWRLMQKGF